MTPRIRTRYRAGLWGSVGPLLTTSIFALFVAGDGAYRFHVEWRHSLLESVCQVIKEWMAVIVARGLSEAIVGFIVGSIWAGSEIFGCWRWALRGAIVWACLSILPVTGVCIVYALAGGLHGGGPPTGELFFLMFVKEVLGGALAGILVRRCLARQLEPADQPQL